MDVNPQDSETRRRYHRAEGERRNRRFGPDASHSLDTFISFYFRTWWSDTLKWACPIKIPTRIRRETNPEQIV